METFQTVFPENSLSFVIAFRFAGPQTVEHKPETPAPKFDVRNCFPGHFDTLQFTSILNIKIIYFTNICSIKFESRCYKGYSSRIIKNFYYSYELFQLSVEAAVGKQYQTFENNFMLAHEAHIDGQMIAPFVLDATYWRSILTFRLQHCHQKGFLKWTKKIESISNNSNHNVNCLKQNVTVATWSAFSRTVTS